MPNYFLERVESSIVMHNTSTQFADGGGSEWVQKLEYQLENFMQGALWELIN